MSVPLRPEHAASRRDQLSRWLDLVRERLQLRRQPQPSANHDMFGLDTVGLNAPGHDMVGRDSVGRDVSGQSAVSLVPGVLVGAMVALLGLGAVWAWQTWSGRVSVPIDDRLPMLVSIEQSEDLAIHEELVPATQAPVASTPITTGSPLTQELESSESERTAVVPAAGTTQVVVHVSGAVARPGVVELDPGARVVDALVAAGGAANHADLDRVNLAAMVVDGERLHVPGQGEDAVPAIVAPSRATGSTVGDSDSTATDPAPLLDINTAPADALEALPGVGPATAQAIVRTRMSRGPFLSVDELLDVPGIGESKLAQIAPFVMIGP